MWGLSLNQVTSQFVDSFLSALVPRLASCSMQCHKTGVGSFKIDKLRASSPAADGNCWRVV
jgi:hypothetical protein